ncbi:MAG: PEP/pyruvate-binding domain-containing protein [Anaerolineae bacterium]|nr:MAG: PEP/pyruvate-binding domain-containing protein [Anaerolineae bacterium]
MRKAATRDEAMTLTSGDTPKVLEVVLELKQYPILASQIRERMRQEIFDRGVISPADFEREVRERAKASQYREGLTDPLVEEPRDVWQQRLALIRDDLTDFYFAHNIPHWRFEQIVQETLRRRAPDREVVLSFNPELAPWAMLFALGEQYENYPPEKRVKVQHHLKEIVVVLTKGMISDQLDFVALAREFFTVADLREIRRRRIGRGKIGGKAAGMLLAWKILQRAAAETEGEGFCDRITIPESYFIGADVFYDFLAHNDLFSFMNQKYKSREEIETEYPRIRETYIGARFPDDVIDSLRWVLEEMGNAPLVVRSSSLLEDNFGFAFAGKYDSFFLPNQGTPEENLKALTHAISAVYASVLNPNALLYRRHMGLLDYDERMAILLQKVVGGHYGHFFLPALAGVAFSRNPFRWNPRIRREDGLVRLVWGLGTRAVDRVSNDYPRMIALSHPTLRPEMSARAISKYSQRFVDLLNLQSNAFETLPVPQVIAGDYPALPLLASQDKGDYVQPIFTLLDDPDPHSLVLTFDNLLSNTDLVALMKCLLKTVERHYGRPIDIEFAVESIHGYPHPQFTLTLLQCRPLSFREWGQPVYTPEDVPEADKIFTANRLVPHGVVSGVRYVIWIDPRLYDQIPDLTTKLQLARVVGQLNKLLEGQRFILMGPGRWGSANVDLGVKVSYADIHNVSVLVEVALARGGHAPEVSYGTHFFQDLVEAQIYPLPLYPDSPDTLFDWRFFDESPNALAKLAPDFAAFAAYVKLIDVPAVTGGRYLEIVMNDEEDQALAYLRQGE